MFQRAELSQAQEICDLVNLAYRGEQGWTNESSIIQGDRTSLEEIALTFVKSNGYFFVVYHLEQLIACVYINQYEKDAAFVGFFSVHPDFQGQGIGKHVLGQVEHFATDQLQVKKLTMFVVSQRAELIAYYCRRGYHLTGEIEICPASLGTPRIFGLTITYLQKDLNSLT